MEQAILSLLSGLGLGFASALHCAGMCGGIAGGLLHFGAPRNAREAAGVAITTHAGRITAYVAAGVLIGSLGAPAVAWLDREAAFRLLQWAGAAALMWIGLSTAGLLPPVSILDRALSPLSNRLARLAPVGGSRYGAAYLGGLTWGLMPCAMVYAALFTAMLTGSASGGGLVMTAFGIGTLPALAATTAGLRALTRIESGQSVRRIAGLAIGALGMATLWMPHGAVSMICAPGQSVSLTQINGAR